MGWKAWTRERLTAALLQSLIQDQVVQQYTSRAQRTAEGPTVPKEGMASWLADERVMEVYTAGGWHNPHPLGIVMHTTMNTDGPSLDTTTATRLQGVINGATRLYPDRLYEVKFSGGIIAAVANPQVELTVRAVRGLSNPAATDHLVSQQRAALPGVGLPWGWYGETAAVRFTVAAADDYTFAPFYRRTGGTGAVQVVRHTLNGLMHLIVEDKGSNTLRLARQSVNDDTVPNLT